MGGMYSSKGLMVVQLYIGYKRIIMKKYIGTK